MANLLLLHGFTGAPSSWDTVVAALPGCHPVMPWLTGHGSPPAALERDTFEGEVERLLLLAPAECVLAGYSLGARLALGMLARAPNRFSAAVLVSGSPGLADESERALRRQRDAAWCDVLSRQGLAAFVERWQGEPLFASQTGLPERTRAAERERRLGHTAAGLCHSLRVTGLAEMPSYWPALSRINCPVSLLAGALDRKFCDIAAGVVRKLPNGYFAEVPEAGHNLLLERPEAVASAIAKGLRS
ncbi:MAG TPA: alpha/beta fold hydrolase [Polyangiaceae bacterium]|nr:alpha/beta fold hydrolase [Polyangiaceae bacterium]